MISSRAGSAAPRRLNPIPLAKGSPARTDFLPSRCELEEQQLWTIFVILLVLWPLGMVGSYTLGGYIHILLVVALVVVLIGVIQRRSLVS